MKITKMKNTLAVLFTILLLLVGSQMAFAGTIFQDNFNSENGESGVLNYTGFANWTVSSGTVDLIGNGYFDFYHGNGLYVDLDGSTWTAGLFSTKMSFAADTYVVSFDLGGSQRGDTNGVDIAMGNFTTSIIRYTTDPLTPVTLNVTTTGGPLTFHNLGGDNVGAILDNITVSTSSAVPEPSTMLLLGLGLAGVTGLRRKV